MVSLVSIEMIFLKWLVLSLLGCCLALSPPLVQDDNDTDEGRNPKPLVPYNPLGHLNRAYATFKKKYVTFGGGISSYHFSESIEIAATNHVSDLALDKAALIVSLMVRHMPHEIFSSVARAHGVGIFTKTDTVGVYPENHNIADTLQCAGNCYGACAHTCTTDNPPRKYSTLAGLTNSRSVVLDDNVLCNANDPYAHKENVLVHEFSHLVKLYSPASIKSRITYVYNYAKTHNVWYNSYATFNEDEYWAEASTSFFHAVTRLDGPTGGMNKCSFTHACTSETENRAFLKQHDPWLFDILQHVYTNNNPSTPSGLATCM